MREVRAYLREEHFVPDDPDDGAAPSSAARADSEAFPKVLLTRARMTAPTPSRDIWMPAWRASRSPSPRALSSPAKVGYSLGERRSTARAVVFSVTATPRAPRCRRDARARPCSRGICARAARCAAETSDGRASTHAPTPRPSKTPRAEARENVRGWTRDPPPVDQDSWRMLRRSLMCTSSEGPRRRLVERVSALATFPKPRCFEEKKSSLWALTFL